MKILLLEDDMILNELIEEYLKSLGYEVEVCYDGMDAIALIEQERFDLFLFDVGVPKLNGFELLEYLRDIEIKTPTIFITSLHRSDDVAKGFGVGAHDYIKKPFELKELAVRIENIKNIFNLDRSSFFDFGNGYKYDYKKKAIYHYNTTKNLAKKEALILEYFIQFKNQVVSFDELITNIWQQEEPPSYATIRTYIKVLRKHLPKGVIVTLKGIGYKLEC